MQIPDITEAEWIIMEKLWGKSPQIASKIAKSLHWQTGWAENTVRTMLGRLAEKGMLIAVDNPSGVRTFAPAFTREMCVSKEGESFLKRIFQGSAKPLLVHFASQAKLSPEEVREMKQLLDQKLPKKG